MSEKARVLVIGATQGTGLETVRLLRREGYAVRVFARDGEKARAQLGETVDAVIGDLRTGDGLKESVRDVDHIVFTAGVTKRPCREELIVETEFEGMKRTLAAAREAGFSGKFLFLSSIGVTRPNGASRLLNLIKGNALKWRLEMEHLIRRSGFRYVIVRAGYLTNGAPGRRAVELGQREHPLELKYRIARKDVARIFVDALKTAAADHKTFDAVLGKKKQGPAVAEQLAGMKSDR